MLRSEIFKISSQSGVRTFLFSKFSSQRCGPCRGYAKLVEQHKENSEPTSRSWESYAIPAMGAIVLAIVGAGTYVHYNDEKRAIPKGSHESSLPDRSSSNRPAIGGPFKLFDTENHMVTESDLRGNWTLMYFGYTSSPDVGPEEVQKMTKVMDILEAKYNVKITPVFVTIDPQRDSPEQLQAYLREFDSRIIGLTGPISAIRQIAHEFRVHFRKIDEEGQDYLVESSNNMCLLDPNMEAVRFFGLEYDGMQLADSIVTEVKKASKS